MPFLAVPKYPWRYIAYRLELHETRGENDSLNLPPTQSQTVILGKEFPDIDTTATFSCVTSMSHLSTDSCTL